MISWLFDETCEKAYMRVDHPGWSLDEVLDVLHYFFDAYEEHRGEPHPPLTVANLIHIIEVLPYAEADYDNWLDCFPEDYPGLIDEYFNTRFSNCDYRINHFLSGRIRDILTYRLLV